MSKTYQKYRAAGLCGSCGGSVVNGRANCSDCRGTRNNQVQEFRNKRIAAGLCNRCGNAAQLGRTMCQDCLDKKKDKHQQTRLAVLEYYGSLCRCCGEARPAFLAIDHVNGGGNKHRKQFGRGVAFYRWVLATKPEDIQILCHNCNQAKGFYGECPHVSEARV